jgi:hypothetical protein
VSWSLLSRRHAFTRGGHFCQIVFIWNGPRAAGRAAQGQKLSRRKVLLVDAAVGYINPSVPLLFQAIRGKPGGE